MGSDTTQVGMTSVCPSEDTSSVLGEGSDTTQVACVLPSGGVSLLPVDVYIEGGVERKYEFMTWF